MDRAESYLENPKLKDFKEWACSGATLVIEELWESPKALLTALIQQATGKHLVILTTHSQLFDNLPYFSDHVPMEFPAWESLPSEEIPPSPDIVGERYRILRAIQESDSPQLIVSTLQAVLQKLLPPERLERLHLILKKGSEVPFELLPDHLSEMGYHRRAVAADKGEFAVRGGIIDIFPVNSPDPFRIEFWDDEIASIRKYDPISQTSVGKVEEIVITPGEELELLAEEKNLATLFDYLGPNTIVVFDDIQELEEKYVASKGMAGAKTRSFATLDELLEQTDPLQKLYFAETALEEISAVKLLERTHNPYSTQAPPQKVTFECFNHTIAAHRWHHPFFSLNQEDPLQGLDGIASLHFVCQNESEKGTFLKRMDPTLTPHFEKGYLSTGFVLEEPPLALIPTAELTHRYKVRRQKQRTHYHTVPTETLSLTPGEAVVHMNSGIGRFLGIERRPNHLGVETEFMLVEYAQGGKLYVPMENANLISKYIGATDTPPEFHTLGSSRWQRSRERTQQAIIGYANDLLKLQAERVIKGGEAYPPDSDLTLQFGDEFPYVETPDQLLAIQQIQSDMQGAQSMDRLVCGDVGYGKTEVAMRAAFKTVVDGGKQVAVLVPTTMLALQHYETFCDRMSGFPIRIAHISRFRKPKELKQTLVEAGEGKVDILIGTHRIVSKDVAFHNLGLVIIDEEQRFGVRAKEHLKKIRSEVDCLTLSATPIPRTLYMSLVGARDLSVINTPPEDRLPIQSVVCASSDELIKNALMRELARDGQAYVVHNRVETIYKMADKVRTLLPGARIVVGHGQMSAQELDLVFHAFKSGQADILVATSIIENGIDIPRANTILIDRADRFGLADLYQMRGRVGRWNRKAYCYFMVPSTKELSELSRKRLSALTQGGNGMKIAMHDLEIRGAGNILGTEQSGHVAAIGFQLYCKLLKKTVTALQKKETPLFYHEVKVEFPFDARLPDDYINETSLRMDLYQRLGDAEDGEEVDLIIEEVRDRFGPLPPEVEWLRCLSRLRIFAARNSFTLLKMTKLVFIAEQSHGKKNKISKKMVVRVPKTPQELEQVLINALKENFPIKP
ncbi:MAG: Transcription-repair-coupling factor [Chlamydiales bacterium]|nr:Transcription-repair-coupling factor [Chlamydiales bacterium]